MNCTGDILLFLFMFMTLDITCKMQNSQVSQHVTIHSATVFAKEYAIKEHQQIIIDITRCISLNQELSSD